MKHRKPSVAEVSNDPSLRWNLYRRWEALYSDSHGQIVRFVAYCPDGMITVASINGVSPYPDPVPALTLRRPSVMSV